MNRSVALAKGTLAASALIAACSAGADPAALVGSRYGAGSGAPNGPATTSSSSSGGSSSSSGTSSASSSGGVTAAAPPPDAGPGSVSSSAHQFFDGTVYPELASTCAPCHASGANGAPTMMAAPADTTYSQLDAFGLIQPNSLLVTKGTHDNGAAPALTTQEQSAVATWLQMEAQEATGSAAPTSVLAQVAQCVSQEDWSAIGWAKLKTQPRADENPDKCSGCAYALCASCHAGGEQGFFMDLGTSFDPDGSIAFQQTFQGPQMDSYVIQYFGLNGTTPVASNAILVKQQAVATGPAYSHPMFVMPQAMQTAMNTFASDAITKYENHTCAAGASRDGGP